MAKLVGAALVALALLESTSAVRKRRSTKVSSTAAWSTVTDKSHGACAEHIKHVKSSNPVYIPLLCTAPATGLKMKLTGFGHLFDIMRFEVNGEWKGEKTWPFFGGDLTWTVSVGSLSAGVHTLKFWGEVRMHEVRLEGSGAAACSFDIAPDYSRAGDSATYGGFDALNNLFGPEGVKFSEFKKRQAYFVEESLGKNADGSISSHAIQEGMWYWLYDYTQNPSSDDPLGEEDGWDGLWNESRTMPWKSIRLDAMRGRSGQSMKVIEPCNTLSSLAFNEATVWLACKGLPFERDEMASLIVGFNALSAGTAFQHVTGTKVGGHADVFAMKWLMLQIYQIMVKSVIEQAGDGLTQEEKLTIETFGYSVGKVTDLSKQMTQLFSEKYDRDFWDQQTRAVDIPDYMLSITGLIVFALYGVEGAVPIPGLRQALDTLTTTLLDAFDIPGKDYFLNTYIPAVQKALGFSNMCSDAVMPALGEIAKFAVIFIEALIFQEQTIPVPPAVRDVLAFLDNLGLTGDLLTDMKVTWDYYNGENCTARSDHANWHEKASHGLIHFVYVAEIFLTKHNC